MKTLENKNVVITGGAAGIGKKIALRFAAQKANLKDCRPRFSIG